MNISIIKAIAKKEFRTFVNSPLAYTVMVPFLLISVFLYMRTAMVSGDASLRPYFDLLPWFLLFLAPALSMNLLTDEYKSNTIELLFAHPISETEIILGKFTGALAFFCIILAATLGLPFTLLIYSKADPGQMIGQYIGALFTGATFLSLGLAASAYVKNAISSFLLAASIGFLLIVLGFEFISVLIPPPFGSYVSDISILARSANIARGLLDIRDIMYFFTMIGVFLIAAIIKLSARKIAESPWQRRKLNVAFIFILGIGLLSNIILRSIPVRLDLTTSKLFSVSKGTKQTIQNLKDIVSIKLFISTTLPPEMQSVQRSVTDLLSDYQKLGKNIRVSVLYPDTDTQAASQARASGIREVTFNKMGSGKFELQSGYLGIAIGYGDKTESIPFIQDTTDLEYQITKRIRKLTSEKIKTIGMMTNGYINSQLLTQLIESQYEMKQISPTTDQPIEGVDMLLVMDSGESPSTASAIINTYLEANGNVLALLNGMTVNSQSLSVTKSQSTISEFLKGYGITLNSDMVFDTQLGEILAFGSGANRYLAPYPYWIKTIPDETGFTPLSGIKSISLAWPSSFSVTKTDGVTIREILTTGPQAGASQETYSVSPQSVGELTPDGKKTVGVYAQKNKSRLIAISTASVADDQMIQNNNANAAFLAGTIDLLVADSDLASIPPKTASQAVFIIKNPVDLWLIQYGNIFIPPVAVTLFALWYLRRRKQLSRRVYAG